MAMNSRLLRDSGRWQYARRYNKAPQTSLQRKWQAPCGFDFASTCYQAGIFLRALLQLPLQDQPSELTDAFGLDPVASGPPARKRKLHLFLGIEDD